MMSKSTKLSLVYLSIIFTCTLSGFLAGQYICRAESAFMSHQKQLYFSSYPRFNRIDNREDLRKMPVIESQLLIIVASVAGFLLGSVLVFKSHSGCAPGFVQVPPAQAFGSRGLL